jgi:hypothetical protein
MLILKEWMELDIITLSDIGQTDKGKYHMLSVACRIRYERK